MTSVPLSLKLKAADTPNHDYGEYEIHLCLNHDDNQKEIWSVSKRYREFEELKNELGDLIPPVDNELMPKKHPFKSSKSPDVVAERTVGLAAWLVAISRHPSVTTHPAFREFLKLNTRENMLTREAAKMEYGANPRRERGNPVQYSAQNQQDIKSNPVNQDSKSNVNNPPRTHDDDVPTSSVADLAAGPPTKDTNEVKDENHTVADLSTGTSRHLHSVGVNCEESPALSRTVHTNDLPKLEEVSSSSSKPPLKSTAIRRTPVARVAHLNRRIAAATDEKAEEKKSEEMDISGPALEASAEEAEEMAEFHTPTAVYGDEPVMKGLSGVNISGETAQTVEEAIEAGREAAKNARDKVRNSLKSLYHRGSASDEHGKEVGSHPDAEKNWDHADAGRKDEDEHTMAKRLMRKMKGEEHHDEGVKGHVMDPNAKEFAPASAKEHKMAPTSESSASADSLQKSEIRHAETLVDSGRAPFQSPPPNNDWANVYNRSSTTVPGVHSCTATASPANSLSLNSGMESRPGFPVSSLPTVSERRDSVSIDIPDSTGESEQVDEIHRDGVTFSQPKQWGDLPESRSPLDSSSSTNASSIVAASFMATDGAVIAEVSTPASYLLSGSEDTKALMDDHFSLKDRSGSQQEPAETPMSGDRFVGRGTASVSTAAKDEFSFERMEGSVNVPVLGVDAENLARKPLEALQRARSARAASVAAEQSLQAAIARRSTLQVDLEAAGVACSSLRAAAEDLRREEARLRSSAERTAAAAAQRDEELRQMQQESQCIASELSEIELSVHEAQAAADKARQEARALAATARAQNAAARAALMAAEKRIEVDSQRALQKYEEAAEEAAQLAKQAVASASSAKAEQAAELEVAKAAAMQEAESRALLEMSERKMRVAMQKKKMIESRAAELARRASEATHEAALASAKEDCALKSIHNISENQEKMKKIIEGSLQYTQTYEDQAKGLGIEISEDDTLKAENVEAPIVQESVKISATGSALTSLAPK